jgi:ADP-ribosylglycohydrolase
MGDRPRFESVLRARAAFLGLVTGDALGAAVEGLAPDRAQSVLADDVMPAAPADHPFWPGQPAGTTTDDTAQSLLLARRLIADGPIVDSSTWTDDLAAWVVAEDAAGRGAHIGPSTRQAFLHAAGDGSGSPGTTNGSSMRVVPLGIALAGAPELIVEAAVAAGRPAHDSDLAHSASAAVAAAIAAGISGATIEEAIKRALVAAESAHAFGFRTGKPPFAATLRTALRRAVKVVEEPDAVRVAAVYELAGQVGTGVASDESVVLAFVVALVEQRDSWRAARLGASLGGDADTMAGLSAAIVGATTGMLAPSTVLDYLDRTLIDEVIDLSELLLRVT